MENLQLCIVVDNKRVYTYNNTNLYFEMKSFYKKILIVLALAIMVSIPQTVGAAWEYGNFSIPYTVTAPTAPTVTLSASPTSIASGASSTLTWSSTNATSCTASGDWSGSKATSGSQSTGALTASKTYTITCTGAGGTTSPTSATVTVAGVAPTVTLTATPSTVVSGSTTTLSWSSTNATSCTAGGDWGGSKATSGSGTTSMLSSNQTYTLTCTGPGGNASATATVTVTAPGGPSTPTGFTASASSTCANNWLNLSWNAVSGATSYTVMEGARLVYSGSGTSMSDTGLTSGSTHSYTLTASNSNGTSAATSASGTVYAPCAGAPAATLISEQGSSVPYNSQLVLWWTTANVTACTANNVDVSWTGNKAIAGGGQAILASATKTYAISCTGPNGPAYAEVTVAVTGAPVTPAPTVSISASPTSVTSGGSSTLSWSSTNATSCTASNGWSGSKTTSGSVLTGGLYSSTTYTLTCTGPGGSTSSSATVTVTPSTAITITLTASPESVMSGEVSDISYYVVGAQSCYGSGSSDPNWGAYQNPTYGGITTMPLTAPETYTLSCSNNQGGSASESVTVMVDGMSTPKKPWWREF